MGTIILLARQVRRQARDITGTLRRCHQHTDALWELRPVRGCASEIVYDLRRGQEARGAGGHDERRRDAAARPADADRWWVTLAAGAVVLVVVTVLLHVLAKVVEDVDSELKAIWVAGQHLARNTATTWMIPATSMTIEALGDELEAVRDWRG